MKSVATLAQTFIVFVLTFIWEVGNAQDSTKFGFYAGVTTLQYKGNLQTENIQYSYSFSPRITVGAGWQFPLMQATTLRVLSLIQDKGFSEATRDAPEHYEYDATQSEHLIQIVIQPQIHYWATSFLSPFVGLQAGATIVHDCECKYPNFDFTMVMGVVLNLGKGLGLSGSFLITPYTIARSGFISNQYNWKGAQVLLSYEY